MSLALAALTGATATWALTPSPGTTDRGAPSPAPTAGRDRRPQLPDEHAALALAMDERSLRLAPGDRIDLLVTDLATGHAEIAARDALVVEVSDAVAAVAVHRDDLPRAAAGASQGLLVPVLVERHEEGG